MAFAETANLAVKLDLGGNFVSQMGKAQASLKKFEGSTKQIRQGTGQLARGLGRVATVGAVALGGAIAYTAKQAIDFQDAFQGVVKTVDEKELKAAHLTFDKLSDAIRKMSTEMPNSAIELAGIAESAGALGIHAKDIEAFTRQVAILASTTNVSAEDAATALGQLQNVIGLTGDEFDNFAASLVDLGNKGASTEADILEIARRAGGAAKLFGISKEATLGWAAAAANLGLNSELAGTSLQNTFIKLLPKVSKGSKDVGKIMGLTAGQVKKAFAKDASGSLEKFIAKLGKMPKDARLEAVRSIFGKGSGLTRLILGLSDSVENNLDPSLRTSVTAWKQATAAQIEFEKRNKTVRSAITRLHNVVIDAAVSVGEGFAPALGRAADKLSNFLKSDANRQQLKDLGKEIGDFIDKIDWDEVIKGGKTIIGVMRTAGDMALRLLGLISKLPKEVLAVGGGALVLNKISGGLLGSGIGNIAGGLGAALAKSLAASIPFFGRAFVQPVFVTNLGAGGLGGGIPGGGGGGGLLGTAAKLVVPVTIAAVTIGAAKVLTDAIDPGLAAAVNHEPGAGTPLGNRDPKRFNSNGQVVRNVIPVKAIEHALQNISTSQAQYGRLTNGALQDISTKLAPKDQAQATVKLPTKLDLLREKTIANAEAIKDANSSIVAKGNATVGAERAGASSIVGAIRSIPTPVTNVTTNVNVTAGGITKTVTVHKRYGPIGGSQVQDGSGVLHNGAN